MADGPTTPDDFTPEQLKALQDIAQARVDDSLSRRDALKALGMVGGGAATGAVGASTLADPAKADASTTDSDGDVGSPNNPVDGFFDGVDATSVNTDRAMTTKSDQEVRYTAGFTDGSNTAGISEAVNDMGGSGKIVVGPPNQGSGPNGEYLISGNLTVDQDNLTIHIPEGSTLKMADGADLNWLIIFRQAHQKVIVDGTVDANRQNQSSSPVRAFRWVDVNGALDEPTLTGSGTIKNTKRTGIEFEGSSNGCTEPLVSGRGGFLTFEGHRSDATGNSPHSVIQFTGGEDQPKVERCIFEPVINDGLHIDMGATTTENGSIENNVFRYDGGTYRIVFATSPKCSFVNNTIAPAVDTLSAGMGDMVRLGVSGDKQTATDNVLIGLPDTDRGIVAETAGSDKTGLTVERNIVIGLGNPGIELLGDDPNGEYVTNSSVSHNTVLNCNQNNNSTDDPGTVGLNLQAAKKVTVEDNIIGDDQSTATQDHPVRISSACEDIDIASDNQFFGHVVADIPNDLGATRSRWDGVIGGGPFGGVDLGSVNGQYEGDQAKADGTTATVSDVIANWDNGATQWVYPDSTSTV